MKRPASRNSKKGDIRIIKLGYNLIMGSILGRFCGHRKYSKLNNKVIDKPVCKTGYVESTQAIHEPGAVFYRKIK